MKVTVGTKEYNIPDAEIEKLKKSLDISTAEAIETWLDDHDITVNDEQVALDAKASAVKIDHGAGDVRKRAERKPKERKVDDNKGYLLSLIRKAIEDTVEITDQKNEVELSFKWKGESYTIKLTKHRKK